MRLDEVCETAGVGKTFLYKLIGEGAFPKPVNIADRAVLWVQDEVEAWNHGARGGEGWLPRAADRSPGYYFNGIQCIRDDHG